MRHPRRASTYIGAMKAQVDDQTYTDNYFGGSTPARDRPQAGAVGTVLGSLRGAHAEAGFEAIGDRLPMSLPPPPAASCARARAGMPPPRGTRRAMATTAGRRGEHGRC